MTPVPPPPGLSFTTEEGMWQTGSDWQPTLISEQRLDSLSPDGQQAIYQDDDDIWLIETAAGERRNLTEGSFRRHCCAQWWPARPGIILLGSWPIESDLGPSKGFLTALDINSGGYRVLDADNLSNALPGPSPDGQMIAYDRAGEAWLYLWETGSEALDLSQFNLPEIDTIAGPAWSPDGRWLAWTVGLNNPNWQIALALLDMEAGTGRLVHSYENIGRGGWFDPPSWSPDGRYIAFVAEDISSERRGVWVVSTDGEEEIYIGPGTNPLWSPDNRWLYFTGVEESESVLVEVPSLVEVGSWYLLRMGLPPGAHVIGWPPAR